MYAGLCSVNFSLPKSISYELNKESEEMDTLYGIRVYLNETVEAPIFLPVYENERLIPMHLIMQGKIERKHRQGYTGNDLPI